MGWVGHLQKSFVRLSSAVLITALVFLALPLLPTFAQAPATVTVDTTAVTIDGNTSSVSNLIGNPGADGHISFLEALAAVNNTGAGHTINFDLPHGATVTFANTQVLTVASTVIDGDVDGDGRPDVVLDGPNAFESLEIVTANNIVQNLVVTALSLSGAGAHGNRIENCYIGTGVDGTAARDEDANGVEIQNGAHHNVVENNIIGGNTGPDPTTSRAGILITSSAHENQVRGNWIGVGVDGNALPNEAGIFIRDGAWQNIVGGARAPGGCTNPCNVIGGNSGSGIVVEDAGTIGNTVQGNYIGVSPDGATAIPNAFSGIQVRRGATQNTIGGVRTSTACDGPCNVISGNSQTGVRINEAGTLSNTVQGNYIGVRPDGTAALANSISGILIAQGAAQNTIGGMRTGAFCDGPCNVISGNTQAGVWLRGSGTMSNVVAGNYVGLNPAGTAPLGNGLSGIEVAEGAAQNRIGGAHAATDCDGPCNVIGGNGQSGVLIWGASSNANLVQGNYIGTNATGTASMPNKDFGIQVTPLQATEGPKENQIGGNTPGTGNLISGNALAGIALDGMGTQGARVQGNRIGTDKDGNNAGLGNGTVGLQITEASETRVGGEVAADGNTIAYNTAHGIYIVFAAAMSNTIRNNSIHNNGGLGISIVEGAQNGIKPPGLSVTTTRARGRGAPPNATI